MTIRGTKVLVTGADGFIGSHLVERLVRDGAEVRAMGVYNSHGSWGWLDHSDADIKRSIDMRLGDIRDAEWINSTVRGVDVVLHLAALIAIPYSYAAPRSFVETNVVGTLNVLEACRRADVRRVVNTSTSEVYGTPSTLPIRETHPLQPQSPYAASKVAADQLALSYHRSFDVPVGILRPFNTYGPRQSMRAVLPTILAQLIAGRREVSLGRTDTRRDLCFVADTVDAFVRCIEADGFIGETTQLGTNKTYSIAEIFAMACEVLDVKATTVVDEKRVRPDASEVLVLLGDYAVAQSRLGWQPTVELHEGLARTAEFIRKHQSRYDLDYFHT